MARSPSSIAAVESTFSEGRPAAHSKIVTAGRKYSALVLKPRLDMCPTNGFRLMFAD